MANVMIGKTGGYIFINMGSYYPLTIDEGYHYFPLNGWGGMCKKTIGGEEGLEFHIHHESSPINLARVGGLTNFIQVDSVNGVAPTSIDDLRDLILNLINPR